MKFYNKKYADGTIFLVIRSLSYFDDADAEAMPNMCIAVDWQAVKAHISYQLNDYLKTVNKH